MKKIVLAVMLLTGMSTALSAGEFEENQKACDAGSASECFRLGMHYYTKNGVTQDYVKVAKLFGKACDGGYAEGCATLAFMYEAGQGVKQDDSQALELRGKACADGFAVACNNLGYIYREGFGVKQDYSTAAEFFSKACDGGNAEGCYNLGYIYYEGAKQDYSRAVELFARVCDGDNGSYDGSYGCYHLGDMYRKGHGVKQDKDKAVKFYTKACHEGILHACSNLGSGDASEHSKKNSSRNLRHFPFVCYENKSGDNVGNTLYSGCVRSSEKCTNIRKTHFGKYPNNLKAHEAFERCSKGNR